MQNHGLIIKPHAPKDWHFGNIGAVGRPVLREDGQWNDFLPTKEYQNRFGLETMGCVSFSALNVLEMLWKSRGMEANFSDRFLAKASGTGPSGNWLTTVAETIRKVGVVSESEWPWTSDLDTWGEYYADIPAHVMEKAGDFVARFDHAYEHVSASPSAFSDALRYGPLQVYNDNHAFCVTGYSWGSFWRTFDTYGEVTGTLPWSYPFRGGMLHYVTEKIPTNPNPPMQFQEGFRYFVADGPGATLFYLAGKMRKDDLAKCLDQWIGRNDGALAGKSATVTQADLVGTTIYDLKGNPVPLF